MKKLSLIILLLLSLVLSFSGCDYIARHQGYTGGSYDRSVKNAPTTIKSEELEYFRYNTFIPDAKDIPYSGRLEFRLEKTRKGALCSGIGGHDTSSGLRFDFEFLAPQSSLKELAKILDEENVARVNGTFSGAIGIPEGLGAEISASYRSGEVIRAEVNDRPLLLNKSDLAIYYFFLDLARNENPDFIFNYKDYRLFSSAYSGFSRLESGDGVWAFEFPYYGLGMHIYKDGQLENETSLRGEGWNLYNSEDGNLGPYKYFESREGRLWGIDEKGQEEILPFVQLDFCPYCSELIELRQEELDLEELTCPNCNNDIEIDFYTVEKDYGFFTLKKIED